MDGWGLLASPLKKGESVPFPQEGGKEGTQVSGQEPAWKKPGKQEYARGSRDVFPSAPPPPVPSPHSPSQTRCPGGRGQPTANVNKAPAPEWKPARRELARVPAAAALRRCASAPEIDLSKASFIRASAGRGEPGGAPRTRPWPLPLLGMTWGPHKPPLRAAAGRFLRAEALRKPSFAAGPAGCESRGRGPGRAAGAGRGREGAAPRKGGAGREGAERPAAGPAWRRGARSPVAAPSGRPWGARAAGTPGLSAASRLCPQVPGAQPLLRPPPPAPGPERGGAAPRGAGGRPPAPPRHGGPLASAGHGGEPAGAEPGGPAGQPRLRAASQPQPQPALLLSGAWHPRRPRGGRRRLLGAPRTRRGQSGKRMPGRGTESEAACPEGISNNRGPSSSAPLSPACPATSSQGGPVTGTRPGRDPGAPVGAVQPDLGTCRRLSGSGPLPPTDSSVRRGRAGAAGLAQIPEGSAPPRRQEPRAERRRPSSLFPGPAAANVQISFFPF